MALKTECFPRSQKADPRTHFRPIYDDLQLRQAEGDYESPRHQNSNFEVILAEKGSYQCELNEEQLTLNPGQVLVITPGDCHQEHMRDGRRHYALHFKLIDSKTGAPIAQLFDSSASATQQVCNLDRAQQAWILCELQRETNRASTYAGAVQDGLLEILFWRIVRGFAPEVLSRAFRQLPADEIRREEIEAAFMRFISKNPNMDELAAELRMSPRKLLSLCRALFGDSPARLLLRFKMRRADELLRDRALRVQEVSDELGFANPYHFSNVYRRLRGCAPTHWLNSAFEGEPQDNECSEPTRIEHFAPETFLKGLRQALALRR